MDTYSFRYTAQTRSAGSGDGNRLARIENGTLITHTLDVGLALPEVLVAYESGGTEWYLHLPNVIATDAGTAWSYSAADGLGSVRQRLDASRQVDSINSYRPFGLPLEGNSGDPYGFTGEWWTSYANRGILYLRARYLAPYLNQFVSPDSIIPDSSFPPSIHRYSYAFNNPIRFVDPSGRQVTPYAPSAPPIPQPRPTPPLPIGTPTPQYRSPSVGEGSQQPSTQFVIHPGVVDACRPDGWDVYQYDKIVSGIKASMNRDTAPRIDYPCSIFGIPFFCSGLAEEEISGEGQAYNAEGQLWLGISSIVRTGLRGQVGEDLEGGLFADIMDTVKISINIGEKGAFLEGEAFNTQIEVRLPGYVYVLASKRAAFKLGWETAKRIAVRETWGSGYRFVRSVPDVVPPGSNINPRLALSALQLRGYQIQPWPESEFSQY